MSSELFSMDMEQAGSLIKEFEAREGAQTSMPGLPLILRLDGRSFSGLTKKLEKPFDARLTAAFDEVMVDLFEEFKPALAYTQSDEITLVIPPFDPAGKSALPFKGRLQKICSVAAGRASSKLALLLSSSIPEMAKKVPTFDCRAFNVPDMDYAALCVVWREADAMKNSVSMLASSLYPHSKLEGLSARERKALCAQAGKPWEGLEDGLKRGRFAARRSYVKALDPEVLARIPESRRPAGPVARWRVERFTLPPLRSILNLKEALFAGADPELAQAPQE